jgi:hypothetical protein
VWFPWAMKFSFPFTLKQTSCTLYVVFVLSNCALRKEISRSYHFLVKEKRRLILPQSINPTVNSYFSILKIHSSWYYSCIKSSKLWI